MSHPVGSRHPGALNAHLSRLVEESLTVAGKEDRAALQTDGLEAELSIFLVLPCGLGNQPTSLARIEKTNGRDLFRAEVVHMGAQPYLECTLVTSEGEYPVRVPVEYFTNDSVHQVVIRYTGLRLDLFLDGVLLHQFGVAVGGLENGVCLLEEGSQISLMRCWSRSLEDREVLLLLDEERNHEEATQRIHDIQRVRYRHAMEVAERSCLRPACHFTPPAFWINDPNGMIFHKGEFHLFYQHNPHGPYWGTMHWGHARTSDFQKWEHLPIALEPELGSPDRDGCFSGVAHEKDGVVSLYYTAVYPEVQCIARGSADLITWEKCGPLKGLVSPPYGDDTAGFRDPFIWGPDHQGVYRMVVGSGRKSRGGAIPLYTSTDLHSWELTGSLLEGEDASEGTVWECPSYFEYPNGSLLVYSAEGHGFVRALVGDSDGDHFHARRAFLFDDGHHVYAPQGTRHPDGRVIFVCWVTPGISEEFHHEERWAGCLSLPREVAIDDDGILRQRPMKELSILRRDRLPLNSFMSIHGRKTQSSHSP